MLAKVETRYQDWPLAAIRFILHRMHIDLACLFLLICSALKRSSPPTLPPLLALEESWVGESDFRLSFNELLLDLLTAPMTLALIDDVRNGSPDSSTWPGTGEAKGNVIRRGRVPASLGLWIEARSAAWGTAESSWVREDG